MRCSCSETRRARPRPIRRRASSCRSARVVFHGVRRYAVSLRIDGQAVEAGLDTGSTGLRVLPRALSAPAVAAHGENTTYSYASGVEFRGHAIRRDVAFGALGGSVPLMRIDHIGCRRDQPDCPFASADPATYGIQGDGVPGQGFAAILGVGLKPDMVANPLEALGARAWIVELPPPRRCGAGPAHPQSRRCRNRGLSADRPRRRRQQSGRLHRGAARAGQGLRAHPLRFGAPGLRIMTAGRLAPWPPGTPAELAVGDRTTTATMTVEIGRREQGSGMMVVPRPDAAQPRISLGIAPYFRWSVLYDATGTGSACASVEAAARIGGSMFDLTGMTALVTGASGGIGSAIAGGAGGAGSAARGLGLERRQARGLPRPARRRPCRARLRSVGRRRGRRAGARRGRGARQA